MSMDLLCRCFLSSITAKTFTGLDCLTRRVSYKKWLHLWFCGWVSVAHLFSCLCCPVVCCDVRYDFHIKKCSVRLCLQLFVGLSYCVLCVCLRILMSSILLLLIFLVFYVLFFVLFVFVLCRMCLLLPISLDKTLKWFLKWINQSY